MREPPTRSNPRQVDSTWSRGRLVRLLGDWAGGDRVALHRHLADKLRSLVHTGDLPTGVRLPSERTLSAALAVSRTTVSTALDELRAEGLIVSRQGAGTYVSRAGQFSVARGDDRLNTFVTDTQHDSGHIDLRSAAVPGLPLVSDEIHRLGSLDVKDLVTTHGYIPGGLPELRDAVASYYDDLALATNADQVLITSGAQQALRLVCEGLLEPGARVIVEEPTFRGAIDTLRTVGAQLIPVPSGPAGIDLGALRQAIATHRPALVFVQTGGNNPTGAMLDEDARAALARIIIEGDTMLVEDLAVADAVIDGPPLRPAAAFGGRVATIGSASKSFWGGLRVGWVRADPELVHQLTLVKGAEDLGTSVLAQILTVRLLDRIDEARAQRQEILSRSRGILLELLADLLPSWRPLLPHAGASTWVQLPRESATTLTQRAERAGVSILAGPTFSCVDRLDDCLRIPFAAAPETIIEGVRRLASVWTD